MNNNSSNRGGDGIYISDKEYKLEEKPCGLWFDNCKKCPYTWCEHSK